VNRAKSITVGLFGYYGRHNFGDDLMAALFARATRGCGAECLVFGGATIAGRPYGAQTTNNIDELVERSDLVVYGGGGALLPQSKDQPFSRLIGELVDACKFRSIPLACMSIGGAGLPLRDVTPPARRRLVESAAAVTVRDSNEALLLRDAGVRAEFFEDVVWTTAAAFPRLRRSRPGSSAVRIAVNLYPNDALRRQLDATFAALGSHAGEVQWRFVESHTFPAEYRQAYGPTLPSERFESVQFEGVEEGLEFLLGCDLVITSRLHIGVAAMSFGIPCVALAPEPKTKNCFAHLGLLANCWNEDSVQQLGRLDDAAERHVVVAAFDRLDRTAIQANAAGHFDRLRDFIVEYSS
jgi:polysaccharide pyruvyl transferase WcaK-like protein